MIDNEVRPRKSNFEGRHRGSTPNLDVDPRNSISWVEPRRRPSKFDFLGRTSSSLFEIRVSASNLNVDLRNSISWVEPRCRSSKTLISRVDPRCRSSKFDFRRRTSMSTFETRFPGSNLVVDLRNSISWVEPRCRSSKTLISRVDPRCRSSKFDFRRRTSMSTFEIRFPGSNLVVTFDLWRNH